ncbi:MAG: winged-helix domain-containing protein [Thermoguttaceae bacterium]|nr:winged-helix domain-containing protein [Thermoguttaceae bacterium]
MKKHESLHSEVSTSERDEKDALPCSSCGSFCDGGITEPVPAPTLRRFPGYLQILDAYERLGYTRISCTQIGNTLGLVATQVRRDLAMTGIVGQPRTGYSLQELRSAIRRCIGWDRLQRACVVGVGALGSALLSYPHYHNSGLLLVAGFDSDARKVYTPERKRSLRELRSWLKQSNGVRPRKGKPEESKEPAELILPTPEKGLRQPVYPMELLEEKIRELRITVGILTVPLGEAQICAERLVAGGIQGILNFASAHLEVPREIPVENVSFTSGFAMLSNRMKYQAR